MVPIITSDSIDAPYNADVYTSDVIVYCISDTVYFSTRLLGCI